MRFARLLTILGCVILSCTPATNPGGGEENEDQVIPVESIRLEPSSAKLYIDESLSLRAIISPENATETNISWSIDNNAVASVENGLVLAKTKGAAKVTATVQNKSASCNIIVEEKINEAVIEVKEVEVKPETISIPVDETAKLTATIQPSNATATIVWQTDDPEIAEISANGMLTGKKEGNTTVTASAGGKSGSCAVTVTKKVVPVDKVTVTPHIDTLFRGEVKYLTATVEPNNATYDKIVWESDDSNVVSVDENGKILGISAGNTHVYARAGGKSDSSIIFVIVPVTSLSLNYSELSLFTKGTIQLIATVLPADASDKKVTWDSTDKTVATVSNNGLVTAVAAGSTTISAKVGKVTVKCTVTVFDSTDGNHEGTGEEDWK